MIANYHTHTWRCNHASGKEVQYVDAAVQRGLKILGFADHSPYFFSGDYYSRFRMWPRQLDDYISTILALREEYRGKIELHVGLELEYYPSYFPKLLDFLRDRPVEYLLLGQHFIGDEMGEHYSGNPTADESILRQYCRQTMDAMNTGLFTYLAHPDLLHFTGSSRVYRHYMRQLCAEANSCGIPVEINLLGLSESRHYPNGLFWEIAGEEGCQAVLGCDAHSPKALTDTATEEKALALAGRYGIPVLETVPLRPIR